MNTHTKPLAGYIRVSRKGDRDELRSPELQQQAIERYANSESFEVVFFPPEIDVSGSKPKRKVLDEIIVRIESGELGGIVVAKLNRLSRLTPKDRALLFEEVEGAGGVVRSASESLDASTPEGRFAREVFLAMARMEWERYDEGLESAKAAAIAAGIPIHNRPPVGYRARADRRLEPDPAVAPVVRELFERRATGAGPSALADFLRTKGITTSQGSAAWSKQAVYEVLRNRVYLGEISYGKNRRYVNPKAHERIVDLPLFEAAQHPNGRRLAPLKKSDSSWILTGILRCASCSYSMQGTVTSRGKRIYRCTVRHAGGRCPAPARVGAELVEEKVLAKFWERSEEIEAENASDARVAELAEQVGRAEAEAERSAQLLEQWLSPEIQAALTGTSEYGEGLTTRRGERDRTAAELGYLRELLRSAGTVVTDDVATLRERSAEFTTADWREALAEKFDCLALGRDRRIVFYFTGMAPADLPRRGFRERPALVPLPDPPAAAGVLALEPA